MPIDMMRIAAYLQPRHVLLGVDVRDRRHALEILADETARLHGIEPEPVFRALWRREQAGSTGLGGGFSIPHACAPGIERPLTLFMRPKAAIAFDAPDRAPVSQILAIVAPVDGVKEDHLQLLALVAQLFSDQEFRRRLDEAPDTEAAATVFRTEIARVTAAAT